MYRLVRDNDGFSFVEDHNKSKQMWFFKSSILPPWEGICRRTPLKGEKHLWHHFIEHGETPSDRVDPTIFSSWERCRSSALDPVGGKCDNFLPEAKLANRNDWLLQMARPIIRSLNHCLHGSEFLIVLIDRNGYVLKTSGDSQALRSAEGLRFGPGANWREESVGTNAIGTALAIKKPFMVTGPEHYCESHHLWTCSAAPIRDYRGVISGFIDISGPQENVTPHQLGLVVAAASAIEERICLHYAKDHLSDTNQYLEAILNSVSDGVVAVNSDGRITSVNREAAKTFRLLSSEILGKDIGAFIHVDDRLKGFYSSGRGYCREPIILRTPNGRIDCLASANPIIPGKDGACGAVLTFSKIPISSVTSKPAFGFTAKHAFTDLIGESDAMRRPIQQAKQVAQSGSTVLILGESGTGKEVLAQAIHSASAHRNGPFIPVNCGAIAKDLIQSELFGYSDGAFTGAQRGGRTGKFQMADGGTLFLDEIGEMPYEMQVNLLRVVEEKSIVPVGGKRAVAIDVRILAATHKSLLEEVAAGNFREDLYYRLNAITIQMPSLRDRKGDIRALTAHFVKTASRNMGREIDRIDEKVFLILENHRWPGNVRELINAIEYAVNFIKGRHLQPRHLPDYLHNTEKGSPSSAENEIMELTTLEKRAIERTLRHYDGNISKTATSLGIGRNTLYFKMKKYNIRTSP